MIRESQTTGESDDSDYPEETERPDSSPFLRDDTGLPKLCVIQLGQPERAKIEAADRSTERRWQKKYWEQTRNGVGTKQADVQNHGNTWEPTLPRHRN